MKKLFENFWLKFGLILGSVICTWIHPGLGFGILFLYFVAWMIYQSHEPQRPV